MAVTKRALNTQPGSLGAVIVNWNTADYLLNAVHSFVSDGVDAGNIVVVDQGSKDESVSRLRRQFRRVKILSLPENLGYSAAVNAGVLMLKTDYFVVANADVRVQKGALAPLKSVMESSELIAVVGPKLVDDSGHSVTRFSRTGILRAILLLFLPVSVRGWWRNTEQRLRANDRPFPVSWVEGSFMFIRRSAFDEVGGFNEGYSFYFEDGDFAIRLKQLGHHLHHCPAAQVIHYGGRSFARAPGRSTFEFYRSCVFFYSKHFYRRSLWLKKALRILLRFKLFLERRETDNAKKVYRLLLQDVLNNDERIRTKVANESPLVSVVIPTYGRVGCLVRLLRSLQRQTYRKYEVVIVDQTEKIDKKKLDAFKSLAKSIRVVRSKIRNRSHAKNLGIRVAKGELLLFLDDDVELPSDLIATHTVAYHDSRMGGVSCRVSENGLPRLKSNRILRITSYGRMIAGYQSETTTYVRSLVGGNMSIPRIIQQEVGEFDPSFGGTSIFEEPDISARIRRAGYNILFTDKTTVFHSPQGSGNIHLKHSNPVDYYHWFHHNEILFFLKNHSRICLVLVIPFCMLRTAKQSLKFHLTMGESLYILEGVVEGWKTYSRIYH